MNLRYYKYATYMSWATVVGNVILCMDHMHCGHWDCVYDDDTPLTVSNIFNYVG